MTMGLLLYLSVDDDASPARPALLVSSDGLYTKCGSYPADHLDRLSQIDGVVALNRAIPQACGKHNGARLWTRYRAPTRSHHIKDVRFVPDTGHTVDYMREANQLTLPRRHSPCPHRQCPHPTHLWEESCRVCSMLGRKHYDEELCGQHLDKWHTHYHDKTPATLQFVAADTQVHWRLAVCRPPRLKRQGAFRASSTASKRMMP